MANNNIAQGQSAIVDALRWIQDLLTGDLATGIAIIALAWLGFLMLQGRLPVRDAMRTILGCFILFAAPIIAQALADLAHDHADPSAGMAGTNDTPALAVPTAAPSFDPYAGASVPNP